MSVDDGARVANVTLDRHRLFRAVLTCTTCKTVVAVGPAAAPEPMAAYELGRSPEGFDGGLRHLGRCNGGALDVSIEEVPNDPPTSSPSSPPSLRILR